ncbi:hypothetical protein AYO45_05235 [Gammaproteobacteria bacterium SCGC AG-212-F23]|nr:hypothetical protein AYO45_05235 [Gammaproteobacteria bacterium SCGC AG-212-F23]
MINRLDEIIAKKQQEITAIKTITAENPNHIYYKILSGEASHPHPKTVVTALRKQNQLSVIAEIKRRSPSKGLLGNIPDPSKLATDYVMGGASAISVLTEKYFFSGNLADLEQVVTTLQQQDIPILRKDFILDEIQIAESIAAGANIILCIVAAAKEKTKEIIQKSKTLGLSVLTEVIDEDEIDIALESGAEIIAINNRNLRTFEIDNHRSFHLIKYIPKNIIKVAASGISSPEQAKAYYQAGFDAVLIGEALVKTTDPKTFIRACYDT